MTKRTNNDLQNRHINKGNNKITEHIVKMYKDKEVKKNVKNVFLSMCDVKMFWTFTSLNMVLF
jgi:hypothetical protein